jgi:HAMP domain-containing protein
MTANCDAVRNQVLALPDPRRVPAPLRAHVADCPGCRAWAEQAARLETLLEQLPVPPAPAGKKDALVDDLSRRPAAEPVRPPAAGWVRRNAALVGGLAAAVLVAGGWWLLGGNGRGPQLVQAAPRDPFLDKVVKRDVALAKADTPAKKLRALGDLAGDLSAEAGELSRLATADELGDVEKWFRKVVTDGLVRQAKALPPHAMPPAERKAELEALAGRLGAAADEAGRAAGESPPDAKRILNRIAETARDGEKELRNQAGL